MSGHAPQGAHAAGRGNETADTCSGVAGFVQGDAAPRAKILRGAPSPLEVDQHPVPLALLWAVDDDEFESLYVAIRADRRAMREAGHAAK